MIVSIDYAALPAAPETPNARPLRLFAYTREEAAAENRADTVRDANHALQIVGRLCGGEGAITEGRPPEGAKLMWTVQIQISGTRRGHSSYRAAYHKESGCRLVDIDFMMEIYHAVKRVLRECREDYRRAKAERKALINSRSHLVNI